MLWTCGQIVCKCGGKRPCQEGGKVKGSLTRRANVHRSCANCALVSTKISEKYRFAHHGGDLPLRQGRASCGNDEKLKAFEASTLMSIMELQYVWAARESGFVRTSMLFSDDFTLR